MRRPLVVTGPPGSGKTTTAHALTHGRTRAAFIDVDDLRHMVVAGHAAPWNGIEGLRQQELGVQNACLLASRFVTSGFDVTIADVLDERTAALYRRNLPNCLIVHLGISPDLALVRAKGRTLHLTEAEFARLHRQDSEQRLDIDHDLNVDHVTRDEQINAVERIWSATERPFDGTEGGGRSQGRRTHPDESY